LPLRIDEIRLALNIFERSYIGLLEPLDHKQGAPLAFLLASKLIVDLVGANELTYRILPMLCSIAGLCVFGLTARRHLHPVGVIFVLAVVSLSPHLIQRAADFKQYSSDFLMTSVMLLVALPWLNDYRTFGCWVALTCVGSLCLLLSHPGVFYVAAVGLVWLMDLIATRKKEGLTKFAATSAIWLLVLLLAYWFNMRYSEGQAHLQVYWHKNFMPTDSVLSSMWWVAVSLIKAPLVLGFGRKATVGLSILALVGQVSLLMRHRRIGLTMLLIILMPLVAAVFHKYPFGDRALWFLQPVLLIIIAEGVNRVVMFMPSWSLVLAICLMYFLPITFPRLEAGKWLQGRYDMPSVIRYLNQSVSENEHVLIEAGVRYPYNFYERRLPTMFEASLVTIPKGEILSTEIARSVLMAAVHEMGPTERFWFVVPNRRFVRRGLTDNPNKAIRAALDTMGEVRDVVAFPRSTIYCVMKITKKD
jgi:hypothetical protein